METNLWGVECRTAMLGKRKLLYLINYTRYPVDIQPKSAWKLNHLLDLRTQTWLKPGAIHLEPAQTRMFEVK